MKLLKRNQTAFGHMPYLGKHEVLEDGRHTGRYETHYGGPIPCVGYIAIPTGYITATWFGIDTDYTHILLMDNPSYGIKEEDRIDWQGATYEVKAVRPSINFLSIAIKKLTAEPDWT